MYTSFSSDFTDTNIKVFMSQETDRFKQFNTYGGLKLLKTWKDIANEKDFENYYNIVKKYALLREYSKRGFNTDKILNHPKFNIMKPHDVFRYINTMANKVYTDIFPQEEASVATKGIKDLVLDSVEVPDIGLPLPYTILNEAIRGWRKETFGVTGMLSNEGKTRFLVKLVLNTALQYDEKILVMLNETTEKEFKYCLLTTVLNNKEFQELHGVKIRKIEKEISEGLYRDDNGKFVLRKIDEQGNFVETTQEFQQRLHKISKEFREVIKVSEWIEEQSKGKVFIKEMKEYDDQTLEFEIRKHLITKQIKYYAYDTIKSELDSIGDWSALKRTCTILSQLTKELKIAIYGSIQLTDDATHLNVFDLTSNNIANAKQLKHVTDYLFLAKQIPFNTYSQYQYKSLNKDWGEQIPTDLDKNKIYYGLKTDKNRAGNKPIVCITVDLDTNEWHEIGILLPKIKVK